MGKAVKILFFLFVSIGKISVKSYIREFTLIGKNMFHFKTTLLLKLHLTITPINMLISFSFKELGVHKSLVTMSPYMQISQNNSVVYIVS